MTRASSGPASGGTEREVRPADGLHCYFDADGTIVEGSSEVLRALGYDADDHAPLSYRRIVDPLHLATILRNQRAAESDGASSEPSRILLITRAGGRIWAEVVLRPAHREGIAVTRRSSGSSPARPRGGPPTSGGSSTR